MKYSGMLKSEPVWISDRRLWFGSNNGSNTKTSEIQTFCLDFRQKVVSEIRTNSPN